MSLLKLLRALLTDDESPPPEPTRKVLSTPPERERLEMMADPSQRCTWDLSPNDRAAIRWAMARIDELANALRPFVDRHEQAGIGPCTEADEDEPPNGFSGDEVFNVRYARATLAKLGDEAYMHRVGRYVAGADERGEP